MLKRATGLAVVLAALGLVVVLFPVSAQPPGATPPVVPGPSAPAQTTPAATPFQGPAFFPAPTAQPAPGPAAMGGFNPLGWGVGPASAEAQTEAALAALQRALAEQYRAVAGKGQADAATKERFAKLLGEIFDLRQQFQQREVQLLEDRLQAIKKQVEERGKKRDAVIAEQVEQILEGKEPTPGKLPNTTPTPTRPGAGAGTGRGAGGTTLPQGAMGGFAAPRAEAPKFDGIVVGLPDDLIGQLLQAKTDADRDLIRKSFEIRIALLRAQLADATRSLKQVQELRAAGAIDAASADRAEARVQQLQLLLEAHENLRQRIK